MITIVGVKLKETGKAYYFDPGRLRIKAGDRVIVETAGGNECGVVTIPPREIDKEQFDHPLKRVLRLNTERDDKHIEDNKKKEKEAFKICQEKIAARGLAMTLVDVDIAFDNNHITFYFIADNRIDFRELVKDLAAVFKTRIELRQIGVRDETKRLGGIGICGRELCCHTYLYDFAPVSIKMAKEQRLSLNPTKISGNCGRLMCCLKNEQATYEYLNSILPNKGEIVETADGITGQVEDVNPLRQRVKVLVEVGDEKELQEFAAEDVKIKERRKRDKSKEDGLTAQEEKELEELEDLEILEEKELKGNTDKSDRGAKGHKDNRKGRQDKSNRSNNSGHHKNRNKEKGPGDNTTDSK